MPKLSLLEIYHQLPIFEKRFCQAYALLFFQELDYPGYLSYLRFLDIRSETGKAISITDMKNIRAKCEALHLINQNKQIHQDIIHSLVIEALSDTSLKERVMEAYGLLPGKQCDFFANSGYLHALSLLCLKIYLSSGADDRTVEELTKNSFFNQVIQRHFYQLEREWIKGMHLKIQLAIFEAQLQLLWVANREVPDLQESMETYFPFASNPNYPEIANLFARHWICTADLRQASESVLSLIDTESEGSLATLASIRFLQGDFDLANALFEKSIQLAKKRLKTTKYYPPLIQGCYYAFTLLKQNRPAALLLKELSYLDKNETKTIFDPVFALLKELIASLSGNSAPPLPSTKDKCRIVQAFCLLIDYWRHSPSLKSELELHHANFVACKRTSPGMARLMAEVLAKVHPHPECYLDYLKETGSLYSISFLEIVPVKEFWENKLEILERFCTSNKHQGEETSETRLLWKIDPDHPRITGVYEQKINAKGKWSKGRPIALERLKAGGPNLSYVTAQELKAIDAIESETISTYSYYSKTHYYFNQSKALIALIGHPNLVDEDLEIPLEFIKGEVAVIVKEEENAFCISLSPRCLEEEVFLESETDRCYQVIEISREQVALQRIIGTENALRIPKSAKKRLQAILKTLESQFTLQSDLLTETVRKEADSTVSIRLSPQDQGLKISLCVRPLGAEGPNFFPGKGARVSHALIKGKSSKVLRDLTLERKNADQLIQSIEPLRTRDTGYDEWFFEESEEVLELLESLQNHTPPLNLLWPEGNKLSVTSRLDHQALSLKVKTDRDWFSLEGSLKIDQDQVIELKQLLELIDCSPSRFVALGKTQFLSLTDRFKHQLREIKALAENQRGNYYLHPSTYVALQEFSDEVGNFTGDQQWMQLGERLKNAQKHSPLLPAALQTELRPYQMEGFQWLSRIAHWGMGACLADDMGLGKTVQALALILEHAEKGATLVVAPTSVCYNWVDECRRFAPNLKIILHSKERNCEVLKTLGPGDLLITSYGILHQDIKQLSEISWQTAILDEAQVIKNANTKRSQAAIQLQASLKVILTGTPIENRLSELWSLFRFINPGLLGSYQSFSKRFIEPIEQHKDAAARQALKKIIFPFVLRRLKSQVLTDLPPRIEQTILVPFDTEELAFYEALRQNALEKLFKIPSQDQKRIHILAEITRLRRACCHPDLIAPDMQFPGSKLKAVGEIIEELCENRHRALIFSQFIDHLDKVKSLLEEKKISYQYLDGSTSMEERKKRVDAFQNGQGDFFLISLKAGGTGLNLTAADYVLHLDPWWNPAVEDQASDRAHRMGQTRPVTIYRFIMKESIEEKMIQLHEEKRELMNDLLDGTGLSSRLSDEELLALL